MSDSSIERLATLFFAVDKDLSMEKFDDKLEVQKIAYLAQEYGIDLGYTFEWYIRGPYCKQVSIDAHAILDSDIKAGSPQSVGLDEEKLRSFAELLKPYVNKTEWLEIAGSLLYLKNESYSEDKFDQIIGYLLEDLTYGYKNFGESIVRKVIADMARLNFIAV